MHDIDDLLKAEDVAGLIEHECEKASCLLHDLIGVFDTAHPEQPSEEKMAEIRCRFKDIGLKLWIASDIIGGIGRATRVFRESAQTLNDKAIEENTPPA